MTLQEKIKSDLKQSMINKDFEKRDLLRVLIGELNRIDKNITDDNVIKIINKMVKNAEFMNNDKEIKILSEYLPQMLGEKQLEILIKGIINKNGYSTMKDMGKIMSELKQKYGSTYDGKMASLIIKKLLS